MHLLRSKESGSSRCLYHAVTHLPSNPTNLLSSRDQAEVKLAPGPVPRLAFPAERTRRSLEERRNGPANSEDGLGRGTSDGAGAMVLDMTFAR